MGCGARARVNVGWIEGWRSEQHRYAGRNPSEQTFVDRGKFRSSFAELRAPIVGLAAFFSAVGERGPEGPLRKIARLCVESRRFDPSNASSRAAAEAAAAAEMRRGAFRSSRGSWNDRDAAVTEFRRKARRLRVVRENIRGSSANILTDEKVSTIIGPLDSRACSTRRENSFSVPLDRSFLSSLSVCPRHRGLLRGGARLYPALIQIRAPVRRAFPREI